jgi:hypothetical protein
LIAFVLNSMATGFPTEWLQCKCKDAEFPEHASGQLRLRLTCTTSFPLLSHRRLAFFLMVTISIVSISIILFIYKEWSMVTEQKYSQCKSYVCTCIIMCYAYVMYIV